MWSVRRRPARRFAVSSFILGTLAAGCADSAAPPPPGLQVSPGREIVSLGDTVRLTVSIEGHLVAPDTSAITWTSLNVEVATVNALGIVRAMTVGVAMIVAASDSHADTATVVVNPPTLRSLAATRNFVIGTAVDVNALRNDAEYRQQLAAEYNGVTSEWAMKFGPIHPSQLIYNFNEADRLVSFAAANGMTLHGHALVWGEGLPKWVTQGNLSKPQLLAALAGHIATVVGRYRGKVASWDVVNEVVDSAAPLRNTLWLRVIGPEYIDSAFVWAHRADPAAKLYLNENHAEGLNAKSDSVLAVVRRLRGRGIPIDGVGFQAHFTLSPPPPSAADLQANLARFAAAGIDVRVSEMDVRVADSSSDTALAREAAIYHDMLDACLRLGTRCTGFTSWGFTDKYSWIPKFFPGFGRALPFDAGYQAKPADQALVGRLQQP